MLDAANQAGTSFPIVGIGASAGGVEAILELVGSIPSDCDLALLVVLHLDPDRHSALPELIERRAALKVVTASENLRVEPHCIYVIPPAVSMTLVDGHLKLQPRNKSYGPPLPIDDLFDSLAKDQGAQSIGVILSGLGSDGALGMQAIKESGGITIAQDEATARYVNMPHAAISLKCVDLVLSPPHIGEELIRIERHLAAERAQGIGVDRAEDDGMKRIFRHLRGACNVDFSHYKRGTIERRLKRRLALHELGSVASYAGVLESDPAEAHALCRDLLIKFTEFFRDPEAFEVLETLILPKLNLGTETSGPIRVWVPGCATGEEVYSIAISINAYLTRNNINRSVQIFGTDVSEEALETARAGRYIENIARNLPPAKLHKYFVKEGDRYRVVKSIRDCCTFARQNVAYDPPFSRIDLLSCRNLLIYLDPTLQKRVMPSFHFALHRDGVLMLGLSETVGAYSELFTAIDAKRGKFFAKKPTHSRPMMSLAPIRATSTSSATSAAPGARQEAPMADQLRREADRIALARYAPASVLCDENFNVLEFRGDTSAFLANPAGAPTSNLQRLARPPIFLAISSAVRQVAIDGAALRKTGLKIEVAGQQRDAAIEVVPMRMTEGDNRWFMVFFEQPVAPPAVASQRGQGPLWHEMKSALTLRLAGGDAYRRDDAKTQEIARLKDELHATRDQIRVMLEEHESALEELKSMEEETLSSNEEFQSTNEELETAKEELQSVNEELSTANDELRFRNRELKILHDEVAQGRDFADAIIETMTEPLLSLDMDLRVIRANRAFYSTFKCNPRDTINCPLYSLADGQWNVPEIQALFAELSVQNPQVREREFSANFSAAGTRIIRVSAVRCASPGNAFFLLTFEDVTTRNETLRRLQDADRQKDEFLAMLAHELRNPLAAIANALAIWKRNDADANMHRQAQAMLERQLKNQVRLVDDLLDVSRITRGIIALSPERIDMCSVIRLAYEGLRPALAQRNHEVTLGLPLQPLIVEGDRTRLEQVITNLLTNANKYTPHGGSIQIVARRDGDQAVIEVTDTGIGMSQEFLATAFDAFVQAHRSLDRTDSGLGMGLTLTRRLVELHGGAIEARSDGEGKGSTFTVRLPLMSQDAIPEQSSNERQGMPDTAGKKILVVDDNRDAADGTALLLQLNGHTVTVAYDAASALENVASFKPDAALFDIGLPGMNGYELCREIRSLPIGKDMLLIALTGYGQSDNVAMALDAGFDEHLIKPASPEQLNRALQSMHHHPS